MARQHPAQFGNKYRQIGDAPRHAAQHDQATKGPGWHGEKPLHAKELEACRATLVQANSDISRLRVYLAQGAEL